MDKRYTFIELKTTGFNPVLDKICFISVTEFDEDLKPMRSYSTWLNPKAIISDGMSKFLGMTNSELLEYPTFSEVVSIIHPFLKEKNLGAFDSEIDIVEFLREALYDEDIKLPYAKKDFIVIKSLEDHIYKRDLSTLYYKYTGNRLEPKSFHTKEMGEILKLQCETLGEDPRDFVYSEYIKNNMVEFTDKFLYTLDCELYLNFGRHKDKNVKEIKQSYLEWMIESDFPQVVKEKIKDYIK